MKNENITRFENAIRRALEDFKRRIEQQRSFQTQNILLKKLHEEIKAINYCSSKKLENLSLEYEDLYSGLQKSGRCYEHIVAEKNLVDTYSAFEKFLFDCFYALYLHFPKFLGETVSINPLDLFFEGNIELCKKNILESQVKSFIQSKNIRDIIYEFEKKFAIKVQKEGIVSEENMNLLHEISLIRNIVVHNNSIVNRIYIEQIKRLFRNEPTYEFNEEETVLNQLPDIVDTIKTVSTKVCEKLTEFIIRDSKRLEEYHDKKF